MTINITPDEVEYMVRLIKDMLRNPPVNKAKVLR